MIRTPKQVHMLLTVLFSLLLNLLLFRQSQAQPATCVTCINCQDVYDGTDMNSTCAATVPNADSCQKVRIQLPGAVLVAKACSKSCKEQSTVAGPLRFDVTCCTTSNCNHGLSIGPPRLLLSVLLILLFV